MEAEIQREEEHEDTDSWIDAEEDAERRAECLVGVEEELREQIERTCDDNSTSRSIDLRASSWRDVRPVSVVTAERLGDSIMFTVQIDDEERQVAVPWPDDPTDPDESLVRILKWDGTSPKRFADIDRIPITMVSDRPYAVAPANGVKTRPTEIVLPGGRSVMFEYPRFTNALTRVFTPLSLALVNTPIARLRASRFSTTVDFDQRGMVAFAAVLCLAPALVVSTGSLVATLLLSTILGLMATFTISLLMILTFVFTDIECER